MPLPRKARAGGLYDTVTVNVWDIETKTIVFTGNTLEVSAFLGINTGQVSYAYQRKSRVKDKYAIRIAKTTT